MLKLFISQPMKGKTDEEILQERKRIISLMRNTQHPLRKET